MNTQENQNQYNYQSYQNQVNNTAYQNQTNYLAYQSQGKICSACGNNISNNATICPICGNGKQAPKNKYEQKLLNTALPKNIQQPRSRWVVLLLAWIGFGLGYLYLGNQNKFADRVSRYIRSILYTITIIFAPYGCILMLYAICLHIYDFFNLTFILKYDVYGNPIKWFK